MRIQGTIIPQAAIDAGSKAMVTGFKAIQIQAAVSAALRADPDFVYPTKSRSVNANDMLDMRVADSLIQAARRAGRITFAKGGWIVK